jgi:hypothetical protein
MCSNGGFHKWRYPIAGWFIRENPYDLGNPQMMQKYWRVSDFPVQEDRLGPLGIVDGHGQCVDDALIPPTAMGLKMVIPPK